MTLVSYALGSACGKSHEAICVGMYTRPHVPKNRMILFPPGRHGFTVFLTHPLSFGRNPFGDLEVDIRYLLFLKTGMGDPELCRPPPFAKRKKAKGVRQTPAWEFSS